MRHIVRIMLFLVAGVGATGCNKSTVKARSDDLGTAAAQREKAMTAAKEAAQSVQNYAYAQKAEFRDAARRERSGIQAEMGRLRTVVDRSTGAARVDAEAKLKVVSDKWTAAKTQLDRAEVATETGWEDVQNRYQTARTDLKNSHYETEHTICAMMDRGGHVADGVVLRGVLSFAWHRATI